MMGGSSARAALLVTAIYALMLRAYPRTFVERYGREMRADARALLRDRLASRGLRGIFQGLRILVGDVVRSAPRERLNSWRERRHGATAGSAGLAPWRRLNMIGQDFQHGLRVVRRSPAFAAAAVVTAGLGIGATAAIFSVLNAVILRPLPFPDPDRLVRISEVTPQGQDFSTSEPNLLDFRGRNRTFESIGAFASAQLTLTGDGEPERLDAALITSDVLGMLGAKPILGRAFVPEDEQPGERLRIVILSEGFWRRYFAGNAGAIGSSITLNGAAFEVIGVMPASFEFPRRPMAWVPMTLNPAANRGDHRIAAIGRLRGDVTLEDASADLLSVAQELGRVYPESNAGWTVTLATFPDWIIGPELRRTMLVLLLAAGLLLLMACANVAHLLLVRAVVRDREMSVRAALGASRGRIARQLLSESFVLASFAGVLGVGLAYAGVPLLMRLSPPGLPRADEVSVNGTVLLFAAAVSLITGLIFGLVPALRVVKRDLHGALRSGARVELSGGRRTREALLAAELALATMLLVGAALLSKSFVRLLAADAGFDVENVLVVPVALTSRYYSGCPTSGSGECDNNAGVERLNAFMTQAAERLQALPGVQAVGATNITPLAGGSTGMGITVEGYTPSGPNDAPFADWRSVTAGFFAAAGLPIVRGRAITPAEERDASPVVVISEAFANRFWPGEDPIGRRMAFGPSGENWQTIVGVAHDMRDTELQADPRVVVYFPYTAAGWRYMTLLIRVQSSPERLATAVRQAIWSIDPALPLPEVQPFDSYRADAVAGPKFSMLLMTIFASVALTLGVLGVYGVTLFAVARRTREFGVRMALGAARGAVLGMVLREAFRPVLLGVALGLIAAASLSRLVTTLLFGTEPIEATIYVGSGALLALIAVLSSLIPAWRATRVDPRVALAAE
ncbi:MAG: ABC transporter permease [Longimicrobiales bacterium]